MSDNLSLSNVINVTLVPTTAGLQLPNINTLALFSSETPQGWGVTEYFRIYKTVSDVITDFGSSSNAGKIATSVFSQAPNILNTNGYLTVIPLLKSVATKANLTLQSLVYTAKTAGTAGNSITITYTSGATKGSEVVTVVSSAISVQIANSSSTATDVYNAIIASTSASALVDVQILSGQDSTPQTTVSSTPLANGSASSAESVKEAIIRTQPLIYYFGMLVDGEIAEGTFIQLASYVQSIDKILFYGTNDKTLVDPGGMLDDVKTAGETHVRCLFHLGASAIDTQIMAGAYAGRALSTDFTGSNTTFTMNLKTLNTILPSLTPTGTNIETFALACKNAGVDIYLSIQGVPSMYTSGENTFFDEVYNELWLKFALQTNGFNFLKQTNYKVPQTEIGMNALKSSYEKALIAGVNNGFIAAGIWTSPDMFGNPDDLRRNILSVGYYIYSQPIIQQLPADRAARKAPLVQMAVKTGGAIHSSNVIVNINL